MAGTFLLGAAIAGAAPDPFVTSEQAIPVKSAIFIGNTTAPEWVLFSGEIGAVTRVAAPKTNCTATNPSIEPGAALIYTPGIAGIGLTSGLKYQMVGLDLDVQRNFEVPGAVSLDSEFILLPPRSVKPVGNCIVTVRAETVLTFNTNGGLLEAAVPPSGLASWWQAEGTAADALGLNPGTLSSSEPVTFVNGKIGQAFHFAGQGYVEVPQSPSLEPSTLTAAAWVHATNPPGAYAYVLSKGASACSGGSYGLYTGTSGGLEFYVFDGTNAVVSADAGAAIWDGNWHLVAGSFDGAAVHLYVDGAEVGAGTPGPITINYHLPTNNNFYIGAYQGSCELRFTGDIDEVQLFSRALLPAEVSGLYNASH